MADKYRMSDMRKMSIGEISQLIGYDYRDFMSAGGTLGDACDIANGNKSLQDVIGVVSSTGASRFSESELEAIRNRSGEWSQTLIVLAGFIVLLLALYFGGRYVNIPDELILLIAFLAPVGFIIWRRQQKR